MANNTDYADVSEMDELNFDPRRLAYIKQTDLKEARAQGIVPEGISLPPDIKLYVLHAVDGSVLGYTDAYDSAYGAAVQNELTPVSVH
jgi:hypothetical protein